MATRSSREEREEVSPTLRQHLVHVKACEASGETLKAYAQRRDLSVQSLYQAKKVARKKGLLAPHGSPSSVGSGKKTARRRRFAEARTTTASATPAANPTWRIRFTCGAVLESNAPLSMEDVLRLADQFRGRT
jgi:hypothetical protein